MKHRRINIYIHRYPHIRHVSLTHQVIIMIICEWTHLCIRCGSVRCSNWIAIIHVSWRRISSSIFLIDDWYHFSDNATIISYRNRIYRLWMTVRTHKYWHSIFDKGVALKQPQVHLHSCILHWIVFRDLRSDRLAKNYTSISLFKRCEEFSLLNNQSFTQWRVCSAQAFYWRRSLLTPFIAHIFLTFNKLQFFSFIYLNGASGRRRRTYKNSLIDMT